MKFDLMILDMDIRKKQHKENKTEKEVIKEIGISRSTMWRIQTGKPLTMETFEKCIAYTKKDVRRYFK